MTVTPTGTTKQKAAAIRFVRMLVLSILAFVGTWLVGPGPGDVFGASTALYIVPIATAVLAAIDKYVRFVDNPSGT